MKVKYKIEPEINEKIIDFIKKYKLEIPQKPLFYLVAYDENNNIIGLCSLQNILIIEPFISENPIVGYNLYQKAEILASINGESLWAFTNNVDKILEKLNFEKININVWRKKWD